MLPIERLAEWLWCGGERKCVAQILTLLRSERVRREGREQHRTTPRQQVQPLTRERPRHRRRHANAVRIRYVEGAMLHTAKCQCVHAHLPRARPLGPARVVTDAADLEVSGRQMTHGVAADDEARSSCSPNRTVQ